MMQLPHHDNTVMTLILHSLCGDHKERRYRECHVNKIQSSYCYIVAGAKFEPENTRLMDKEQANLSFEPLSRLT